MLWFTIPAEVRKKSHTRWVRHSFDRQWLQGPLSCIWTLCWNGLYYVGVSHRRSNVSAIYFMDIPNKSSGAQEYGWVEGRKRKWSHGGHMPRGSDSPWQCSPWIWWAELSDIPGSVVKKHVLLSSLSRWSVRVDGQFVRPEAWCLDHDGDVDQTREWWNPRKKTGNASPLAFYRHTVISVSFASGYKRTTSGIS